MPAIFHFLEKLKPHIPPGGIAAMWLLDNVAYRDVVRNPSAPWKAEFVAAYFHHLKETHIVATDACTLAMKELEIPEDVDPKAKERIQERIAPFLRSIASNMTVQIDYELNGASSGQLKLGPSDGNGISSQVLDIPLVNEVTGTIPNAQDGPLKMSVSSFQQESVEHQSLTAIYETGTTYLAEDGGWSLISDVDDTVKISCVNDHKQLTRNTFVNVPQHSPGMPELYQKMHEAISTPDHPTPFFYISASPYNLYPFLRKFLKDSAYPDGMIILRDLSWFDIHSWYSRVNDSFLHTIPIKEYKFDRFVKVSGWLPRTTWVCVGDSTQSDPEAYAQFYHHLETLRATNPDANEGRVARIWIRKVVGVNPKLEETLNAPERFERAFQGIPSEVWKVFEDGKELMDQIDGVKREREQIHQKHDEDGTNKQTRSPLQ
ncbi:SubName: Full=Uncharacterized protein {ECO:0000313/EMBL:CCA67743.1} [Serendipita indica DSM 11827]|nr:SubName: Full=Uncharacterized protein {ECO:0000313/EMBL:CCA67743.1} [Serendipita indica DSM 11827]